MLRIERENALVVVGCAYRGVTSDEDATRAREFEVRLEVRAHVGARKRGSRVRCEDVLAVALAAKHPFGLSKLL